MADDGNDLEIRVKLDVDDSAVDPAIAKVGAKTGQKLPPAKLDVDGRPATREMTDLKAKSTALHSTLEKKATIHIDGSQGDRTLADLRAKSAALDVRLEKLKASAVGTSFEVGGGGAAAASSRGAAAALGGGAGLGSAAGFATAFLASAGVVAGIAGARATWQNQLSHERNIQMEGFNTRALGAGWAGQAAGIHEGSGSTMAEIQGAAQGVTGFAKGIGVSTAEMVSMGAKVADLNPMLSRTTDAVNAMRQATTGNAGAADQLGIDLTDTHMATRAFGGRLKDAWATLSETQKAQMRYNEMMLQLSSQDGGVGAATQASKDFSKAMEDAKTAVATALAPTMEGLATGVAGWAEGVGIITGWIKENAPKSEAPATAAEAFGRDSYANVRMFGIDLPGLIDPFEPRPTIVDTPATTQRLKTGALAAEAAAQTKAANAANVTANAAAAAAQQNNVNITLQGQYPGVQWSVGASPAAIQ